MTEKDNGGPAFPQTEIVDGEGMSLRDWFAGQALAGIRASEGLDFDWGSPRQIAFLAYQQADAMLAERSKP